MSVSLFDAIVPPYRQIVDSVRGVLQKGADHYRGDGRSPDDLLDVRLFDDMHPLTFQLHSVAHHTLGAVRGVRAGEFGPPSQLEGLDYAGFQDKLAKVSEELGLVDRDEFNDCAGNPVIFKIGDRQLPFTAEGFLFSFSKPNAYFHATTAYDLLRMKGVPLGKRDYLGQLQLNT